ncbi:beta-N-acetylhexosaminidase [Paenibacillus monticola]|uniref:beta-N-acetylhexosaminidase n=1 Tax=Paenibacillus monticola TaxID=2666075 RepID=A0A7X2H706_9BACL|nr:beta-N-acetylhexosaminidase [Paenibacillus monticola]MRN54687.1 beta-N-acetylhexosaminidase [Paenibacillus monticola]
MKQTAISALTLEQKAARLCVAGLPVLRMDSEFEERLLRQPFGGIGLFPHNIEDEEQLRELVGGIMDSTHKQGLPAPYMISIDEEGGSLSNLKRFFPQLPSNRAVGLTMDPGAAYQQGKLIGSQLSALGIPMDWAPVLDVNTNIANPVVGIRSFGEEPAQVAEFGAAYIRGMHDAGVAVTCKHFPGHGQVDGDSHIELPFCGLTLEELRRGPLLPFKAAISADTDVIMMAHIVFPSILEAEDLPASLSPFFITRLLREEMGYEGVICTDDVEMGAIRNTYEPEFIGEMAIKAGNDLILMCHTPDFQTRVIQGIVNAVSEGRIPESKLNESLVRIERLHERMRFYRHEASPIPQAEWEIQTAGLTRRTLMLESDPQKLLPLQRGKRYGLLLPQPERLTMADNSHTGVIQLKMRLESRGLEVSEVVIPSNPDPEDIAYAIARMEDCDVVIQLTLNAHIFIGQLALAEAVAKSKPLIAAVLRNPYDAQRLPKTAAQILVCSTSEYSLEALADLLTECTE